MVLVRKFSVAMTVVVWTLAIGTGMAKLWGYALSPGGAGSVPARWPEGTAITRAGDRDTLVLFAHPRCPCTRATVGELARLMAQANGRVAARVLFIRPRAVEDAWSETDLWRSAAAIPAVDVSVDANGAEARRFGAVTSGHALLYESNGDLLFTGGITGARGHSGDNAGRSAMVAIATGQGSSVRETPVYGCGLFGPDGECAEGIETCAK